MTFSDLTPLVLTAALSAVRAQEEIAPRQDLTELSLEELSELKVTVSVASLFAESELVLGSTVERIERDQWRRRDARNLADAIGASPGVLVAPNHFGGHRVAIRGYLTSSTTQGINTRLDGVPLNDFGFATALNSTNTFVLGALDRVEMIRGPGSSLYGANAFHGVLSLQTFESDHDVLELDGEIGSNLYRRGSVRVSRGLGSGWRLEGALAYDGQSDQDVQYDFTDLRTRETRTGDREHRFDALMGVLKLRSDPTKRVSGRVGLYVKGQDQDGFAGLGRLFSAAMSRTDHSDNESRFGMASGGLTLKFGRSLSLDLMGYGWRRTEETHFDLSNIDQARALLRLVDDRVGAALALKQADNSWNTQWAAGYEFSHQKIREGEDSRVASGRVPYEGDVRRVNSAFVQARTSFAGDALHVLYGARYDNYSDAKDPFSPRAGLIYQPTRDSAIKLLYGHAFRPTSAVEARGSTTTAPASGDPETFDMWELVFMKQSAHGRASVTFFRSDWNDALVNVRNPAPPPINLRQNVGSSRAHGVEMGLTWIESDFRVDGSGSWIESEDRTNDVDYVAFPKYIVNAGAGYTFDALNLDVYLHNRIHLGADEGPVSGFVPDPRALKDYWRTDLTVTWRNQDKNLDLYFAVLNLVGRENFFPSPVGAEGGTPDTGFTISLGLRGSF